MTEHLLRLSESDLRGLTAALRSGRLSSPYNALGLQRFVSPTVAEQVAGELHSLSLAGLAPAHIATCLELLLKDRSSRPTPEQVIELVTSGPETPAVTLRDTSVLVRDLFASAEVSVLVAGYAVYQGQLVFRALADRMVEIPNLSVRMFLDVRRTSGDTSQPADVVRRFANRFRTFDWPQSRPLPQLFYFPLSLQEAANQKAALHAKCVIVDRRIVFISSANFTEAAQERNIEVGVRIASTSIAERLVQHFEMLVQAGALCPINLQC